MGRALARICATSTVATSVTQTTSAMGGAMPSSVMSLRKLHTASVPPHSSAARHSRHSTLGRSLTVISPTAMLRMMVEVV